MHVLYVMHYPLVVHNCDDNNIGHSTMSRGHNVNILLVIQCKCIYIPLVNDSYIWLDILFRTVSRNILCFVALSFPSNALEPFPFCVNVHICPIRWLFTQSQVYVHDDATTSSHRSLPGNGRRSLTLKAPKRERCQPQAESLMEEK